MYEVRASSVNVSITVGSSALAVVAGISDAAATATAHANAETALIDFLIVKSIPFFFLILFFLMSKMTCLNTINYII